MRPASPRSPRLSPAPCPPPISSPQFSYVDADGNPVAVPQLTFLRLLSASARQNFTLTCQHAAAWYDARAASFARALRFRGANDEELGHDHPAAPIRALHDGCQVRPLKPRSTPFAVFFLFFSGGGFPAPRPAPSPQERRGQERTVLEVSSSRVERLPLMDVAVADFGEANQKFGFELGPVCFVG